MQLSPEQQSAVTRTGQDACCVAGPGSGKTRVLVERFAWLIGTGIGPESILAITFTEKAAHELKSRLVTRFESDVPTRQQIEQAPVSTIHGLCQSILREHAISAGLDPEFGILDQWQADLELDAAIRAVLDRMARESTAAFRDLIGAWASEDPAGDLSTVYTAVRMSGGLAQLLAAPPDLEPLLPERAGQCIELLRQSAATLNPRTEPQRRHLSSLHELIAAFDSLQPAEWLRTLAGVNLQGKGKMAGADELKQARDLAKEALPIAVWIRHKDHRAALTRLLLALDAEFRGRLRLIPALDFAALEEHTLALLKSQPEVRASLQQRFKAILMDEVQDTNPIQWDIVKLLRSSNNFFAVGDANQAIYGFRHADPGLFAQYQAEVESGGGVIDRLERNYRSRPEILEAVARFSDRTALTAIWAGAAALISLKMYVGRESWRLGHEIPGQPWRGLYGVFIGTISTLMSIGGGAFVTMMMTRRITSKFVPRGRKYCSSSVAVKSMVMSGTPRMNSMKPTDRILTRGMSDRRPSASRIPIGREQTMAVMPMVSDSRKPPKRSLSTA
jgi:ATP-dependent exoDNAse (exonuclease V) beta subunit